MKDSSHWLTRWRLKIYSQLLLLFFVALVYGVFRSDGLLHQDHFFVANDFSVFWEASKIGLSPHPQDAYQPGYITTIIKATDNSLHENYEWYYPPTYYLVVLPLSLIPYLPSLITFLLVSLAGYVIVMRKIIHDSPAMWCLSGFPGIWINIYLGQNGLLTAMLAGASFLVMESHPILSGIFIGIITFKPHLGYLFFLALFAARKWHTFLAAVLTAITMILCSLAAFGINIYVAWINQFEMLRSQFRQTTDNSLWLKMPSVFSFMRSVGAGPEASFAVQAFVTLFVAYTVWSIWKSRSDISSRAGAVLVGTMLSTPYLFSYDLAWLGVGIAWMVKRGLERGWLKYEREMLLVCWLLPLLMAVVKHITTVQVSPLFIIALFVYIVIHHKQSLAETEAI